jgi:WD40 repeat protein
LRARISISVEIVVAIEKLRLGNSIEDSVAADQIKARDTEMKSPFKYRAFISYSHKDKTWGEWLHRSLERYKVPEQLVGTLSRDGPVPKSLFPIFRDRDELPSSANLNDQIRDALNQSAYLIVVCSPNAVSSRWVNEEIALFKKLGREDRILAFVVAGEPNASDKSDFSAEDECFPSALQFRFDSRGKPTVERLEPVAADARPQGDGRESAKLKLIAGLLGIGYDALRQREVEAARRRTRFYRAVAASMALLATGAAISTYFAYKNFLAERAQRNNTLIEQSRFLADLATQSTASGDHELAMLFALEALPDKNADFLRPYIPEAELALFTAQQKSLRAAEFQVKNVRDSIFLPDGKRVLIRSEYGNVSILNPASGKIESWALKHKFASIAFDSSSSLIAAAFDDKTIRIWSSVTNKAVVAVRDLEGVVKAIAISPNRQRVAALLQNTKANSQSATLMVVWDVTSGKRIYAIDHPDQPYAIAQLDESNREIYFSPDGKFIVTFGSPVALARRILTASTVKIRSADTGKIVSELTDVDVMHAAFSPDGRTLFTASSDGTIQVWNIQTGMLISALKGHEGAIMSVRFSADGLRFVTTSQDNTARVWDAKTGRTLFLLRGYSDLKSASLSADGKQIATTSSDGILSIWNLEADHSSRILNGHKRQVNDTAFSPDERKIVTSSNDGFAVVWDAETGRELLRIHVGLGIVLEARFSADSKRVITISRTTLESASDISISDWISVWDSETGRSLKAPVKLEDRIESTKLSLDGRIAIYMIDRDKVRILDTEAGRLLRAYRGKVMSAQLDPSGKRAVVTSGGVTTHVWDIKSGDVIAVLRSEERSQVTRAAFDSDGQRVITVTHDGIITIWELESGKKVAVFNSGTQGLELPRYGGKVVFSLNGSRLLRALYDGGLELWDVTSDKQAVLLRAQAGQILSVTFARNSQVAVTGSSDGTAHIWRLFPSTEALIDHARKLVPRCLTKAQREKVFLDPDPPHWCIEMGKWPYNSRDWKLWLQHKRANLSPPRPDAPEWKSWANKVR